MTSAGPTWTVPLKADGLAADGTKLFYKHAKASLIPKFPHPPLVPRYRRQAELLSRCKHDHIVRLIALHDAENDDDIQLDLELAPYGDVMRFGGTPESILPNRLEQLIQIVDALDYLHNQMKVVHGCLQLDNILIFEREGHERYPAGLVKLGGFGNAVPIGQLSELSPSIDYAPPETYPDLNDPRMKDPIQKYRAKANIEMTPLFDIYSVGKLILRWVFTVDDAETLRRALGKDGYDSELDIYLRGLKDGSAVKIAAKRLPEWWNNLVLSCCDVNPEQRIATRDLKVILETEGRQRVPPSVKDGLLL